MPFRIWWTPGKPWSWFRDEPVTLAKYVARANCVDCYSTLNVWDRPEQDTPCRYDFGFDFDSPQIERSACDANTLVGYLDAINCPYRLYFSGSKGIHVVVPHEATGLEPRTDGGHVCKLFQRSLKETLVLDTLDVEIHGKSRQWRIPNTINSKSGLYKVPITLQQLSLLISDGIAAAQTLAISPVSEQESAPMCLNATLRERLAPFVEIADAENAKRIQLERDRRITAINFTPACIQQVMNDPAIIVRQARTWGKKTPSRNQLTFLVACFLKNHAGASQDDAVAVLGSEWQKRISAIATSSAQEISRSTLTCINTVYRGAYEFSCGMAINYGCNCRPNCLLYRPFHATETTTQA
jgi:hypothetical protein